MGQNISKKLILLTEEAFFDYVLPRIREKYPESLNKFFVNITSSVAYGVADKHSDIDVFILFKDHKDYLKYNKKFESVIHQIKFPEKFEGMCDKGLRFEFESLQKSDVLNLYNVQSYENWMKQTEWLLCWLVNSITIYDPSDQITSFKNKIGFFKRNILKSKVNLSFILLLKYQKMLAQSGSLDDDYLSDFYFFKSCKRLMDLVYWSDKKYAPHPKWQYFILRFIKPRGKQLYKDLQSILYKRSSQRLKLIEKWTDLLARLWHKSNLLDEDLYNFYINEYNPHLTMQSPLLPVFFKDYKSLFRDKQKLFSLIKSAGIPDNFFLNDETNISLKGNYDYDTIMRLQDKYINIDGDKIAGKIQNKRINYLHFIIWRKIRVIQGALKRENHFNQQWYANQVIEHIIEMAFRLKNQRLPPESLQFSSFKLSNYFPEIYTLLKNNYNFDISRRVEIFWKCFFILQDYIKKNKILSEFQINNPLIIQFDIEYWKYENLRL